MKNISKWKRASDKPMTGKRQTSDKRATSERQTNDNNIRI